MENGIADLQREFGEQRSENIDGWEMLREEPPAPRINNGPIIGTIRHASLR